MSTSRRHHHEGSVYQRSDDRWVATVRLGARADGKPGRLYAYAESEDEARENLDDLLLRVDPARDLDERTTVRVFLERWLTLGLRPRVSPGSHRFLTHLVRQHLAPHIGKVTLAELNVEAVHALYAKLERKGASAKTRFHAHMALKWACTYAVRWGLLQQNPCSLVVPPRAVASKVSVLTEQEVKRFLEAAAKDRHFPVFAVALTCGLRKGEVIALRQSDVDLKRRRLTVRRSTDLHTGEDSIVKSANGERIVILPKYTARILADHMRRLGAEGYTGDRVFVTANHTPLRDFALTYRSFRPILAEAGIEGVKFHHLRHTCAAILLTMGVPIRQVSAVLGHARPQFTLDTYGHLIPGMEEAAVERLEEIFKGF